MAHIFVSYSRADRPFVDDFVPLLRKVYGNDSVWFDDDIPGGHAWWQLILSQIQQCKLFIYLLSNEALTSPYCQAEFREALRLRKPFLPVIVRPKTHIGEALPDHIRRALQETQWVDLSRGFKDYQANAELYAAVNSLLERVPSAPSEPLTPQPMIQPAVPDKLPRRLIERRTVLIGAVIFSVLMVTGIIVLSSLMNGGQVVTITPSTQVVSAPLSTHVKRHRRR